jgi:RNA polymerase sigma-70 factor (ECF subfamily)
MDEEDKKCMIRLKNGDRDALSELIERHQRPLSNFFMKMGGSTREDAEDLIQDTFLRLYKAAARYEAKAKFSTFLYMLARHTWIDGLRHKNRRITMTGDLSLDHLPQAVNEVEQSEISQDMQEYLNRLKEKYREVVVLSFFMKFKYAEIAEQLEIPIGTVRSRLHEAMKQLKNLMSGEDEK